MKYRYEKRMRPQIYLLKDEFLWKCIVLYKCGLIVLFFSRKGGTCMCIQSEILNILNYLAPCIASPGIGIARGEPQDGDVFARMIILYRIMYHILYRILYRTYDLTVSHSVSYTVSHTVSHVCSFCIAYCNAYCFVYCIA